MKKPMLFASLAMAAAAFAMPSSASAVWTSNHADIAAGTNPVIHGEGSWGWTSAVGGISCSQVTATFQLTGGSTEGHVQQFTPTLASCKGTGALSGCTVNSVSAAAFPWPLIIVSIKIIIKISIKFGKKISTKLSGFLCPSELIFAADEQHELVVQPDETGAVGGHTTISSLTLGGQGSVTNAAEEPISTAQPSGTITLTASDSHKYGFT